MEIVRVELHGFAPAEMDKEEHERADGIEVGQRVESEAALKARGGIAEVVGSSGVREFVDGNYDDESGEIKRIKVGHEDRITGKNKNSKGKNRNYSVKFRDMAGFKVCERCGKGVQIGHNVSHAKNRTRKVWQPNLHAKRVWNVDKYIKLSLCAKCIRLYRKEGMTPEVRREGYVAVGV